MFRTFDLTIALEDATVKFEVVEHHEVPSLKTVMKFGRYSATTYFPLRSFGDEIVDADRGIVKFAHGNASYKDGEFIIGTDGDENEDIHDGEIAFKCAKGTAELILDYLKKVITYNNTPGGFPQHYEADADEDEDEDE